MTCPHRRPVHCALESEAQPVYVRVRFAEGGEVGEEECGIYLEVRGWRNGPRGQETV